MVCSLGTTSIHIRYYTNPRYSLDAKLSLTSSPPRTVELSAYRESVYNTVLYVLVRTAVQGRKSTVRTTVVESETERLTSVIGVQSRFSTSVNQPRGIPDRDRSYGVRLRSTFIGRKKERTGATTKNFWSFRCVVYRQRQRVSIRLCSRQGLSLLPNQLIE